MNASKSKLIKVFLSSSFKDMHVERDYLKSHAFTILDNELIKLGHRLQVIDLRGAATEESELQEEAVYRLCLNGIEECKPRMIVLLGDRYGWIGFGKGAEYPDSVAKSRVLLAVENIVRDPHLNIEESEMDGKSITHIEITYGIKLMDQDYCFYYFRQSLPYDVMSEKARAIYLSNKERQDALKKEIRDKLSPVHVDHIKTYQAQWDSVKESVCNLEVLNELVYQELKKSIFKELALDTANENDFEFNNYIFEKMNATVIRNEVSELYGFALEEGVKHQGKLIIGEPGSGKSTLFAQVYEGLNRADCFLIPYVAGINPQSINLATMMASFCTALRRFLGMENEGADIREQDIDQIEHPEDISYNQFIRLKEEFGMLLSLAAERRRIVILIDSLDSLEQNEKVQYFQWLPDILPQNVRIIATVNPGKVLSRPEYFAADMLIGGIESVELVENMISTIASGYGKRFDDSVLKLLTWKVQTAKGLPLYAKLAVDYLMNMTSSDYSTYTDNFTFVEWMKKEIEAMPLSIDKMYALTVKRAGEAYGFELVDAILGFVAASRNGVRSIDLSEGVRSFLSKDVFDIEFLTIRCFLRGHFRQVIDSSWWEIEHNSFRNFILKKMPFEYLKSLNDHMLRQLDKLSDNDSFKRREYLWYCYSSDSGASALHHICEIPQECYLTTSTTLEFIIEHGKGKGTKWIIDTFNKCNSLNIFTKAADFLLNLLSSEKESQIPFHYLLILFQSMHALIEKWIDESEDVSALVVLYIRLSLKLGNISDGNGEKTLALDYYINTEKVLKPILESRLTRNNNFIFLFAQLYYSLGGFYLRKKDYDLSEKYCLKAEKSIKKLGGENLRDNANLNLLALIITLQSYILEEKGDYSQAIKNYLVAYKIRLSICSLEPDEYYYCYNMEALCSNLGNCYYLASKNDEALLYYNKSLMYLRERFERNPNNLETIKSLAILLSNMGGLSANNGLTKEAKGYLSEAKRWAKILARKSFNSRDQLNCAKILYKIGTVYKRDNEKIACRYFVLSLQTFNTYERIIKEILKKPSDQIIDDDEYVDLYIMLYKKIAYYHDTTTSHDIALEYYEKLVDFLKQLLEKSTMNRPYLKELSSIYFKLYFIYDRITDNDRAMLYYTESQKIKQILRNLPDER